MKNKFHYNISNHSIKITEAPLNKGCQGGVGSSVAVHQNYPSSSPTYSQAGGDKRGQGVHGPVG